MLGKRCADEQVCYEEIPEDGERKRSKIGQSELIEPIPLSEGDVVSTDWLNETERALLLAVGAETSHTESVTEKSVLSQPSGYIIPGFLSEEDDTDSGSLYGTDSTHHSNGRFPVSIATALAPPANDLTAGTVQSRANDKKKSMKRKRSVQKPPVRFALHQPNLAVYYAYAAFRVIRFVIACKSQKHMPKEIDVYTTGKTRLQASKSKDDFGRHYYEDGNLRDVISWRSANNGSFLASEKQRNENTLIKVERSCIRRRGKFILIELVIFPQRVALFQPHRNLRNVFNLEIVCVSSQGKRYTLEPTRLEVFAKTHKRMQDLPSVFTQSYESYTAKFDQYT